MTNITLSVNNLGDFYIYKTAAEALLEGADKLPFVEILYDNWVYLDSEKILEALSGISDRVAFHIMWSRFLELDEADLQLFLRRLKVLVDEVNPLYVSDHLCRFSLGHNFNSNFALEYDYLNLDHTIERVKRYQDYIERQLLLENFASHIASQRRQLDFFESLVTHTECGILFDISNARVAEDNGCVGLEEWIAFLANQKNLRTHVGSYHYNEEWQCYCDSHGDDLSPQTLKDIQRVVSSLDVASICYEREHNKVAEKMVEELKMIKKSVYCGV